MERSPYESCDVVSTIRNWKWLSFHVFAGFFFLSARSWVRARALDKSRGVAAALSLSLSLKKNTKKKLISVKTWRQNNWKRKKNYHGKKSLWIMRCSFHSLKLKMSVISWLLHRQSIELFTWKSCHIFPKKNKKFFQGDSKKKV